MKERSTARAILLDPNNRLLLSKVSDPNAPIRKNFWCTIGGKMEPGEDLFVAITREIKEEIGQDPSLYSIHGPIWYGEQELLFSGIPTIMKETFLLIRTTSTDINRWGQTPEEMQVMKELKWWPILELERSQELVVPPIMRRLVAEIIVGKIPDKVIEIDLSL